MRIRKFITMKELMEMLCLRSANSIYKLEKEQNLPKRTVLGARRVGYDLEAINNWIKERNIPK